MNIEEDPEESPVFGSDFSLLPLVHGWHFAEGQIGQQASAHEEEGVHGQVAVSDGVKQEGGGALAKRQVSHTNGKSWERRDPYR